MQSENGFPESTQCSVITNGLGNSLSMQHQAFNHDFNNHRDLGSIMEQNVGATIHHMSGLGQFKGETPQTVPVMSHTPPSVSPIDLINQEMMKSERKRQRNRVAASKCRKRKLERISQLEERVKNLKQQNIELSKNGSILRQQVAELKSKVMAHVTSGCQLMMNQQQLQMGEAIST